MDDPEVVRALANRVYSAEDPIVEAAKLSDNEIKAVLRHTLGAIVSEEEISESLQEVKDTIQWATDNPDE